MALPDLPSVRTALLAMGYQEREPRRWLKPVGFHLFTYEEDRAEWTNWFKSATLEMGRYEHHNPKDIDTNGSFLVQLKHWEAWTRVNIPGSAHAEFEFGNALDA